MPIKVSDNCFLLGIIDDFPINVIYFDCKCENYFVRCLSRLDFNTGGIHPDSDTIILSYTKDFLYLPETAQKQVKTTFKQFPLTVEKFVEELDSHVN